MSIATEPNGAPRRAVETAEEPIRTALEIVRRANANEIHSLGELCPDGRIQAAVAQQRASFPDLTTTIEWILHQGNRVVLWVAMEGTHLGDWRGVAPTGRRIRINGTLAFEVVDGQVVDHWTCLAGLKLLDQLTQDSNDEIACSQAQPSLRERIAL